MRIKKQKQKQNRKRKKKLVGTAVPWLVFESI